MTWGVIKKEKALCQSLHDALKDVDCVVYLGEQVTG